MDEVQFEYEHLNYASPYRHVVYNNDSNARKYVANNNTIEHQIKPSNTGVNSKFTKISFGNKMTSSIFGSIIEEERSNLDNTELKPEKELVASNYTLNNEKLYQNHQRNRNEPLTYHDKLPVNSTIKNKIIDLFFNW